MLPLGASDLKEIVLLICEPTVSSLCDAFLFLLRDSSDMSVAGLDSSALYLSIDSEFFVLTFHLKRL